MHAPPIWLTNASPSRIYKFQNIQNDALRITTDSVKMTYIDHLHEETKMLPVQDYLSLSSSQYLARALQPNNTSHSVESFTSGIRNKKKTFQSRFLRRVASYLSSGILPLSDYEIIIKSLHTKAVSDSKSHITQNCVL